MSHNQFSLEELVEKKLRSYFKALDGSFPPDGIYKTVITNVERPLIKLALEHSNYNQLKAAAALGINRNTLRKKIKEFGISC